MVIFSIAITSCSQPNPAAKTITASFTGSTPCDSVIKSALNVFPDSVDFMRWTLHFYKTKTDSTAFELTTTYGIGKPNTNGFEDGGKTITLTGIYTIEQGAPTLPGTSLYVLRAAAMRYPLFLIEMDSNILHFADGDKNLLVGNGGWGYVLNRIH